MGEPVCSFLGRVVVGQVVTVQPAVRAVAAGDKGGVRGTAHVTFTASAPGRHAGLVRCCGVGRSGHLTLRLSAS
jgi:hypothetical protein